MLAFVTGCSRSNPSSPPNATPAQHHHHGPHDGTTVALGDEAFHLEFVLDPPSGMLQAYVMDGELENFIRLPIEAMNLSAVYAGTTQKLVLNATASAATGEKVGDTALFEGHADWLKTATNFDAVIEEVPIRGHTYRQVPFNFPKGNDADNK